MPNAVQQAKVQSKPSAEEELPEKNQPTDGRDNDVRQQDSQEAMPTGRSTRTGTEKQFSSDGNLQISPTDGNLQTGHCNIFDIS